MALNLWLLGHVLLVGSFSATAYGSPQKREAALRSTGWDAAPSELIPVITDFNLRPLNSTSLQAAWKTKFQDGFIHFYVCPLVPPTKQCTEYVTAVKSLECRIDSLKPEAEYNVSSKYQTVVQGTSYKWEAYRTIKMPPPGWVSAASSPVFSGLLLLMSLLYFMLKSAA